MPVMKYLARCKQQNYRFRFRGFSSVYLVEDSSTRKLYAVKKIICHSLDDQTVALNEVKIHNKVEHENVIKLIDYDIDGIPDPVLNATSQIYLLLPYYKVIEWASELCRRFFYLTNIMSL